MTRKLTALLLAALCFALVGCSSSTPTKTDTPAAGPAQAQTDKKDQPAAAPAAPAVTGHKTGETVTVGNVKITVNAVKLADAIGEKKAKDGYIYLVIDATVENGGKAIFHSNPTVQTLAVSADKVTYDRTAVAGLKGNLSLDMDPGAKANGEIAFVVPRTAKGIQFIYTPDLLKTDANAIYACGNAQ